MGNVICRAVALDSSKLWKLLKNAKTNNRGLLKILIVFAVILSVGAYAWFFWFQTSMVIQTHYYYRDIPIASMTPVELNDHSITPANGTKLSCYGYDFEVPWKDVETDKIQRKSMTLIPFRSGLSVLVGHGSTHDLLDTIMERANTNPRNFRAKYSDAPVRSDYDLLGLALNATPARVRLFESKQEIGRQTALVMIKAIIVPGDSGIFKVQAGEFKGFQYGGSQQASQKGHGILVVRELASRSASPKRTCRRSLFRSQKSIARFRRCIAPARLRLRRRLRLLHFAIERSSVLKIFEQFRPWIFRIQLRQLPQKFLRLLIPWHRHRDFDFDDFIPAGAISRGRRHTFFSQPKLLT